MEGRQRKIASLWSVCVVLAALCAYCWFERVTMSLRVAFADDQTKTFDDMRENVEKSSPVEKVKSLAYAVSYYPSGTKQVAGSRLDQIVERARQSAVREMIGILRKKTGGSFKTCSV
jgi:hypothetical protein